MNNDDIKINHHQQHFKEGRTLIMECVERFTPLVKIYTTLTSDDYGSPIIPINISLTEAALKGMPSTDIYGNIVIPTKVTDEFHYTIDTKVAFDYLYKYYEINKKVYKTSAPTNPYDIATCLISIIQDFYQVIGDDLGKLNKTYKALDHNPYYCPIPAYVSPEEYLQMNKKQQKEWLLDKLSGGTENFTHIGESIKKIEHELMHQMSIPSDMLKPQQSNSYSEISMDTFTLPKISGKDMAQVAKDYQDFVVNKYGATSQMAEKKAQETKFFLDLYNKGLISKESLYKCNKDLIDIWNFQLPTPDFSEFKAEYQQKPYDSDEVKDFEETLKASKDIAWTPEEIKELTNYWAEETGLSKDYVKSMITASKLSNGLPEELKDLENAVKEAHKEAAKLMIDKANMAGNYDNYIKKDPINPNDLATVGDYINGTDEVTDLDIMKAAMPMIPTEALEPESGVYDDNYKMSNIEVDLTSSKKHFSLNDYIKPSKGSINLISKANIHCILYNHYIGKIIERKGNIFTLKFAKARKNPQQHTKPKDADKNWKYTGNQTFKVNLLQLLELFDKVSPKDIKDSGFVDEPDKGDNLHEF